MTLDFEDCFDCVARLGLTVILVQVKAKRSVADAAGILGLEPVRQIRLNPRPLVDDKAVMRVEVDTLGPDGLGELDLTAVYSVGVDDDREEKGESAGLCA
jgi:hypothetical protein